MSKKTKLSEEKPSKPIKRTTKHAMAHEYKVAEKPKPVKFVKAALKRADQPKSKAFDVVCDAVGKMLSDGAEMASGASKGAEHGLKRHSKQNLLIALLRHPAGASLSQIMKATGWQAHTVRGVISGVLRKKLCLQIVQERGVYGTAVYKIVEAT